MKYLVQRVEGGVLLEMIIVDDFGKAVLKARDMAEKMQEQLGDAQLETERANIEF